MEFSGGCQFIERIDIIKDSVSVRNEKRNPAGREGNGYCWNERSAPRSKSPRYDSIKVLTNQIQCEFTFQLELVIKYRVVSKRCSNFFFFFFFSFFFWARLQQQNSNFSSDSRKPPDVQSCRQWKAINVAMKRRRAGNPILERPLGGVFFILKLNIIFFLWIKFCCRWFIR